MRIYIRMIMCAVLLAAGLCSCEKDNAINSNKLEGKWVKLYPEGVVADGSVHWTFKNDKNVLDGGTLDVTVYDIFSGQEKTSHFRYMITEKPSFINGEEYSSLPKLEIHGSKDFSVLAMYDIEKCDKKKLVLKFVTAYSFLYDMADPTQYPDDNDSSVLERSDVTFERSK